MRRGRLSARPCSRFGPGWERRAPRSARPGPSCESSMGRPAAESSADQRRAPERRRPGRALATSAPVLALGRGLVRALTASLRLREFPSPGLEAHWRAKTPVIYTVWHGQILLLPYLYGRRFRIHALTRRSR